MLNFFEFPHVKEIIEISFHESCFHESFMFLDRDNKKKLVPVSFSYIL